MGYRRPPASKRFPALAVAESLEVRRLLSTFTVTNLNDSGPGSLRGAISQASQASGSIVDFASGLRGTINLASGQLEISGSVNIVGPGTDGLTVNAGLRSRIFQIDAGATATISGITLTEGDAEEDMGGGAIANLGGTLTVDSCLLLSNTSSFDGGAILSFGGLTVRNSAFEANSVVLGDGAAIMASSAVTVENSTFSRNLGSWALFARSIRDAETPMQITGSRFSDNTGGLVAGTGPTFSISNTTFTRNSPRGGILIGEVAPELPILSNIADCTFSDNYNNDSVSTGSGAAIDNRIGILSVSDSTFSSNHSDGRGGAISNDTSQFNESPSATVTGCTFRHNSSADSGGAIYNNSGSLSVNLCSFSLNVSQLGYGGAICNFSVVTVTETTLSSNTAVAGGAICSGFGKLAVSDAEISDNIATGTSYAEGGGGIYLFSGDSRVAAAFSVSNCTILGNSSVNYGGGLLVEYNNFNASVTNTTIFGNSALSGGGVYTLGPIDSTGTLAVENCIVAGNVTPGRVASDVTGTISGASNLIGSGGAGGLANGRDGNITGISDPKLGPLGNYGGQTETIPLLAGSPALDHGSNALAVDANGNPLTTDQRGLPRIFDGTVEIGAYEAQPPAVRGDVNHDGKADFSDLLIVASHYGQTGLPLYEAGDLNGDGKVSFADLVVLAQNYGRGVQTAAAAAAFPTRPDGDTLLIHLTAGHRRRAVRNN